MYRPVIDIIRVTFEDPRARWDGIRGIGRVEDGLSRLPGEPLTPFSSPPSAATFFADGDLYHLESIYADRRNPRRSVVP